MQCLVGWGGGHETDGPTLLSWSRLVVGSSRVMTPQLMQKVSASARRMTMEASTLVEQGHEIVDKTKNTTTRPTKQSPPPLHPPTPPHPHPHAPLPRAAAPAHVEERLALLHHHAVVVAARRAPTPRRVLPRDDGDLLNVVPLVGARPELPDDLVDLLDLFFLWC